MGEKIGIVAAGYAIVYATVRDWLHGFYGSATRSVASAIVCGIVALNLWSLLLVFDRALASSLIINWRAESLVALIIALTAVDIAVVANGKADQWARAAMARYGVLRRSRGKLSVILIVGTVFGFLWALLSARGDI